LDIGLINNTCDVVDINGFLLALNLLLNHQSSSFNITVDAVVACLMHVLLELAGKLWDHFGCYS